MTSQIDIFVGSAVTISEGSYSGKITNKGTLTVAGGTFTGENFFNEGTLTINDGTFKEVRTNNAGITTINGGTLDGVGTWSQDNQSYAGKLTINGGTIGGHLTLAAGNGSVEVKGGHFTYDEKTQEMISIVDGANGTVTISGGTFDWTTENRFCMANTNKLSITGGTFSSNPTAYVAEGYTAIPAGENVWNVVEGNWVTPATVATKEYKESNMTYHFAAGTYSGTTTLEVGANTNTVFEAADGAEFENLTIKYKVNRYNETDKASSSMTVKGFKVTGTLDINCADGTLVVEGNIAKTAKITMNRQDGKENASILIKGNKFDGGKYGIELVPNHSNYTLTISGNTFSNHSSHAISVMGYQSDLTASDETRTGANTITVSGNTFNSYGSSKAAFKIWGDTKYAPNGTDPLNDAAKALAASVQANNTFATTLDSSCVLADFYGKTVSFSRTSPM